LSEVTRIDTVRTAPDEPANLPVRRTFQPRQIVIAGVGLALLAWAAWWLYDRLTHVYVLDARIASEMVLISSRVPGWLVAVPATEGSRVATGDVLIRIDDREATSLRGELDLAVQALEADAETTLAQIAMVEARTTSRWEAAKARLSGTESELAAARSERETVEAEWDRANTLRDRNLVSLQEWESVRNRHRTAEQLVIRNLASVATASADLLEVESERAEITVLRSELASLNATLAQKRLEAQRSAVRLSDHALKSPVDGVIDELFVDAGEYVAVGQRLLAMHDPGRKWIKAHVKETDIRHLRVGSPIEVSVDAYPAETRRGTVGRIGNAATSQFALMPNPNPSGNFTKVTQRVEVIMHLDEPDPRLLPGMMVEVKVPIAGDP
tara:strand:- start:836 stop:1987 length:1152 start_codon:yes stop_codon:yes gene_type:complete